MNKGRLRFIGITLLLAFCLGIVSPALAAVGAPLEAQANSAEPSPSTPSGAAHANSAEPSPSIPSGGAQANSVKPAAPTPAPSQPFDAFDDANSPVLEKPRTLTPAALQLAEQMGLAQKIQQLDAWRHAGHEQHNLNVLQVKQEIMQAVLVAMLQVRATSAQIAYDVFEAGKIRTMLEDRRDRALKYNTIANLLSGAVSEITGGALQVATSEVMENTGNLVEMAGGTVQSGISALALRQQGGQRHMVPARPNMLAPVFDQNTNQESKYPLLVWRYLNTPPPEGGESRRQQLVRQWLEFGRLSGRNPALIAALSGSGGKQLPVTIDILEDRQGMLTDVSAVIYRIDRLLLEILLYSDVSATN